MKAEPQRWQNWCAATHGHAMQPQPNGAFVLVDDYAKLELMLAEAVRALEGVANCDHAEDGGPTCDHPELADKVLARIKSAGYDNGS